MSELEAIWVGIKKRTLYAATASIGILFEFQNHRTLFLKFMESLYGELSFMAHLGAVAGAAFFVGSIVATGLRKQRAASWTIASITVGVSFTVYAHLWQPGVTAINGAIVILSGFLPFAVAFFIHNVGYGIPDDTQDVDEVAELEKWAANEQAKAAVRAKYANLDWTTKDKQASIPVPEVKTAPPPPINGTKKPNYEFDIENFQ
ncbi:hypothetical protein [Rhodoflexus caldus]|uniref:hypothetical protein n=1 Tax=Rhodoflexus caldus TaxID=2891236 RepID=UPI002029F658|nr:hypothetical protein [Rhodoflexus caldus]